MPDAPHVAGMGVPQPRDPADRPATGTARAVSASASVPMPSRITPSETDEPSAAGAQARVYGRPIQPVDDDRSETPSGPPFQIHPDRRETPSAPPFQAQPDRRETPSAPPFQAQPDRRDTPSAPPFQARPDYGPPQTPPGRISGRASASASVAPPHNPAAPADPTSPADEPPDSESAPFGHRPPAVPYGEPTTDVAGRGRAHVPPRPEYYGELTTDISRRGSGPERPPGSAPMPTWPPREPPGADPDRPLMGGVFPGSASGGAPDQAGGWPPYVDGDQSRFGGDQSRFGGDQSRFGADQSRFGADQGLPDPFQAEQPNRIKPSSGSGHVRMLPVLLSVVIGAILLVGIAIGIVWLISRGSDSSFDVGAGDCVRRSGNTAVKASCSDSGAYKVVSVADTREQCADKSQPYVLNPTKDGKTQVLCLTPSGS